MMIKIHDDLYCVGEYDLVRSEDDGGWYWCKGDETSEVLSSYEEAILKFHSGELTFS